MYTAHDLSLTNAGFAVPALSLDASLHTVGGETQAKLDLCEPSTTMNGSAVHDLPGAAPALVAESAMQTAELSNEQQHTSKKTKRKKDKNQKSAIKSVSIRKLFSLAD
jgi:hypothetical protein